MPTPSAPATFTRFAITHVNAESVRILTRRNIGPSHFDTEALAQIHLLYLREHNTDLRLASIFGPNACSSFSIRPVQCYAANGDAVGSILGLEEKDSSGHWTPATFCPSCSRIHIIPRSRAEHQALACKAHLPLLQPGSDSESEPQSAENPEWREPWQERDQLERERNAYRAALSRMLETHSAARRFGGPTPYEYAEAIRLAEAHASAVLTDPLNPVA